MFSIILAAGKGTRMGDAGRAKVCFEVGGQPVITRAINVYTRCGIEHHILVIGPHRGQDVIETVCRRFPRAMFAFQPEPLGTGHATRCGAAILEAFEYDGPVMVVAGDKVLAESAVRGLIDRFRTDDADCAVLVSPREHFPTSGRIVEDEAGNILGNLEYQDVTRARLIARWLEAAEASPIPAGQIGTDALGLLETEKKASRAFPRLWASLSERQTITRENLLDFVSPDDAVFFYTAADGRSLRLTGNDVERRARHVNLCIFLFRAPALRYALERIDTDNAQGEEYLTDAIGILAAARTPDGHPRFRLTRHCIADKTEAMAFNTPEELEEIRAHYETL